jgi:predicted enzyme related to lactoylglutathione lyase
MTEWFDYTRLAVLEHQARLRREAEQRRFVHAAKTDHPPRHRVTNVLRSALRALPTRATPAASCPTAAITLAEAATPRRSPPVSRAGSVTELRLVVTATNFDEAVTFFRDALGLPDIGAVPSPDGRVAILDAGRATLELADPKHAAYVDEVEVGWRSAGRMRVAFAVTDAVAQTRILEEAGARVIAPPTPTPWHSLNARLTGPESIELTLFSALHVKPEQPAESRQPRVEEETARCQP